MSLLIYRVFTTPVSRARGRKGKISHISQIPYTEFVLRKNTILFSDLMPLISLIADHGTMYFMVANLITGTLNFLFDTLEFVDMRPVWFSATCQLLLLSTYTAVCPLMAEALGCLLFGRRTASQSM